MSKVDRVTMTLAALIHQESDLDLRESTRLADAWVGDVLAELRTSGISVIRGLGTFTMTEAGVRFEQDEDFPTLNDFPAIEGYSAALATAAAAETNPAVADADAPVAEEDRPGPTERSSDFAAADHADILVGHPSSHEGEDISHGDVTKEAAPGETAREGMAPEETAPKEETTPEEMAPEETTPEEHAPIGPTTTAGSDTGAEAPLEEDEPGTAEADDASLATGVADEPEQVDSAQGQAWASGLEHAIEQADSRIDAEEETAHADGQTSDGGSPSADEPSTADPVEETVPDNTASRKDVAAAPMRSRSPRRYERSQSGSSRTAILAIAIVVVIVASALMYRFVIAPPAEEPGLAAAQEEARAASDDSTQTMAAAGDPAAADSIAGEMDASTLDSTTPDSTTAPATEPPPTAVPDPDPAVDAITKGMGGYTLVVGSTLNEQTARAELANFAALGWPMGVLAYESEDVTRYRIAVGHYRTAAQADTARNQFADNLPEGTWVLSVR